MTKFVNSFIVATIALLGSPAAGFVAGPSTKPRFGLANERCSSLYAAPQVASKFFQLQEMEDKETATTEVFLHADGKVDVFETDGPVSESSEGKWEQKGDEEFVMKVKRTFDTGKEESKDSDMGEFKFSVERSFTGRLSKVGESLAVEGAMHDIDEAHGDREVGFFQMIDTTEDVLSYDE